MYRKWYPPVRYVFYPLYRVLRHRLRIPCAVAYLAIWIFSGGLHGGLFLGFGHPVAAGVFLLVFASLGGLGVIAIRRKKPRRRMR